MKSRKWMFVCAANIVLFMGGVAFAQGNGHGHGKGHGNGKHDDQDDAGNLGSYHDNDREAIRAWYSNHANNLPPGLAKKDRLPPGLEKQLATRGTLPPGLQKRIEPVPVELERQLPPPPPDCAHVFIGGNIVLLNRRTNLVLDFFAVAP